jgi:LysM repeat protein
MRITGIALAAIVLLAACGESREVPTLAPAPTLAVVTATPGPPPVPTPGEQQRYVVREGDTLSGIAARFGVSEDAILDANPLSDRDRLLVGQELVIPPAQP